MAGALFPNVTESQNCIKDAYAILDQMIQRGNKLAAARKAELVQLDKLFQDLSARIERRGLETMILPDPGVVEGAPHPVDHNHIFQLNQRDDTPGNSLTGAETISLSLAGDPSSPSVLAQAPNLDFLGSIGISSYEFFSLVNQIGHPESLHVLDGEEQEWDGSI
jgi:hypothetical protein